MRISSYIKSKAMAIMIFFVTLAATWLLLWVLGTGVHVINMVCVMMFVAFLAAMTWDYAIRRRFYQSLALALDSGKDANYIAEHLERPGFAEGQLVYDALVQATKSMNDRIAEYHIAADEYRDYVETWIHEVKTPIAATRLILDNSKAGEQRSLANEMDRIEAYVEQALYYARSTAVEKDYVIRRLALDGLVKACVKKHSRLLIDNGITPQFVGLNTSVYADPKWLDFVLGQVIVNSVKYCRPPSDSFTPQLAFCCELIDAGFETSKVRLQIKDNGIGIPAADLGRVFEKGFTGENGRAFARSTGIGLYLCKKLCEKMKLGLSITSTAVADSAGAGAPDSDTAGTTVSIEFPLSKMYFLEQ